jgi:hypothetical protein
MRALMLSLPLFVACTLEHPEDDFQAEQAEDAGLDEEKGAKTPKAPKPPKNGGSTGGTTGGSTIGGSTTGGSGGTGGQTVTCREGAVDTSRSVVDPRPACAQPYPWPAANAVSDWKNYCGLCAASTDVPYKLDDPAQANAFNLYAGRSIGSPPTTCVNALLATSAFHRTSPECANFRAKYSGVCCGKEPACATSATWYKDSPSNACSSPSAGNGCRCADRLTAPGKPSNALSFAESTFSATSPFASAVRNGSLCGVRITKSVYGTGQYETTCARLYEAARRGLTGTYECGVMEKMLSEKCGSRSIMP